jgi:hypothetical protein
VTPTPQSVDTDEVLKVLALLATGVHKVVADIANGIMPDERQYEFAELLIEAGQLVKAHTRTTPIVLDGEAGYAEPRPKPLALPPADWGDGWAGRG